MRQLINRRRISLVTLLVAVVISAGWLYWNRPLKNDLSVFAPADCFAYVEADDLAALILGIQDSPTWKGLAGPIGAPETLLPNRTLLRIAKWTGIGSADAILFARSQVAVVFSGAEGAQADSTLTIKPLATFIIETHTSQTRMRSTIERHIEELARRVYKNPALLKKQIDGLDFEEWISEDKTHQIVIAFVDTAVIVGNDEPSVVHSIEARNGKRASLQTSPELVDVRRSISTPSPALFGFISNAGVKSLLQAYVLLRGGSSADALTTARIFADTFGGLVKHISWTSGFVDGAAEDRCTIRLSQDVVDRLRGSMVPERGADLTKLSFVPSDAYSFSLYQLRDTATFWTDLNTVVSSHSDLIGAVAARPMLRGLLRPYGIDDPDTFARSIGTRLQTIRLEDNSPSVLVVETFDRGALRPLVTKRLGKNVKTEQIGNVELLSSAADNFAAAFADDRLLLGPVDAVRRCLIANAQSASITSTEPFRRAEKIVDVSLPFTAVTFTHDQHAAISFVEVFAHQQRSAFATNAPAIDQAVSAMPSSISVSMLKGSGIEWTGRSPFGLAGSLVAQFAPGN